MKIRIILVSVVFLFTYSACTDSKIKSERLNLVKDSLFDLSYGYEEGSSSNTGYVTFSGRLKNPLSCTITGMTVEFYIHEIERQPTPAGKGELTDEDSMASAKGKIIDQETIQIRTRIEAGKTNSFESKERSSMKVPKNYVPSFVLKSITDECKFNQI